MKGYMLMEKDGKRKRNSFYYKVSLNNLFEKVVVKEHLSKFKLDG